MLQDLLKLGCLPILFPNLVAICIRIACASNNLVPAVASILEGTRQLHSLFNQAYDESRLRKWTGILIVFSSLEYIMIFSLDHFLDGSADILVDNVGRK